ncbi:MAG: hypothetical protein CMF50_03785 [Legionellales bacterium]|nr:hypothetical protein [Legionellales bacterium]
MNDTQLAVSPVFIALTRPPVIFGVTLEALCVNVVVCLLLFILAGSPLYLLLFPPLHSIGWLACRYDCHCFQMLAKRYLVCGLTPNRHFWRCQRYGCD